MDLVASVTNNGQGSMQLLFLKRAHYEENLMINSETYRQRGHRLDVIFVNISWMRA